MKSEQLPMQLTDIKLGAICVDTVLQASLKVRARAKALRAEEAAIAADIARIDAALMGEAQCHLPGCPCNGTEAPTP